MEQGIPTSELNSFETDSAADKMFPGEEETSSRDISGGSVPSTCMPSKDRAGENQPIYYCPVVSLIERRAKEPDIPMIWSGIKKGTMGFVYGPAKSGRTIFCENLGMSIAAGETSYLGRPLNSSQISRVLFISMEEHWSNRAERNQKQLSAMPGIDIKTLPYTVVDEAFPHFLMNDKGWRTFEETISHSKADLVFVDSFTRMIHEDIEKSRVGSDILKRMKELTMRLNLTLVIIHHSSKITNMPLNIANMAGSRVVGQEADFILGINKLSNNTRYFKEVSTRYKQEDDKVTTFTINDNLWLVKGRDTLEESLFRPVDHRENPDHHDLVLQTIRELNLNGGGVRISDLIGQLEGTLGKTGIYRYLSKLESNGLIHRSERGIIKTIE